MKIGKLYTNTSTNDFDKNLFRLIDRSQEVYLSVLYRHFRCVVVVMSWMGHSAQAGETRGANNQADSLIRRLERLIIEKIREFRASLHSAGMTDVVKKMDVIFIEFRQYICLQKKIIINTWIERLKKACTKLKKTIEKLNEGADPTQGISWALITARVGLGNVLSRVGLS